MRERAGVRPARVPSAPSCLARVRLALVTALLAVLAVVAIPLGPAAPAHADVDDFAFRSFDAVYRLSTDADGRSVLRTTETLVAEFPDRDQNRGIRRELVASYDGHPTGLRVLSVTDEAGDPRAYESDSDDGALVLTVADDGFVRGEQTYVIDYEQHDVTRAYADTGAEELYWDVNGLGWAQPFARVSATVEIAPDLLPRLTGDADAASGPAGADGPAEITRTQEGFRASAADLGPREGLTLSIGFEPGTFTPRDSSFLAAPWPSLSLAGALLALAAAAGALVLRRRRLRDAPGRGTIVAEYDPPEGVGLLVASVVSGNAARATTALLLDLAVRGAVRILERDAGRKPSFALELVDPSRVTDPDERRFVAAVFGDGAGAGATTDLKRADAKITTRIQKLMASVRKRTVTDGLRKPIPVRPIVLLLVAASLGMAAALAFAVLALVGAYGGLVVVAFLVAGVVGLTVTIVAVARHPLTERGVALRDHLAGLREFIRLAEADRIRMLQSPEGAERRDLPRDDRDVLRLTEELLPYAAMFGQERAWGDELGRRYEHERSRPGWYAGQAPFAPAAFASSLGSVSSSMHGAYSGSSSSGGSTGGTTSGGGGGGGGGGGV
ncbi:putative membrane protein YgcG [Clavibacter sp. B3I6]|nr:putative membrane protein YgcG [Clavibacter sp. B3I6]